MYEKGSIQNALYQQEARWTSPKFPGNVRDSGKCHWKFRKLNLVPIHTHLFTRPTFVVCIGLNVGELVISKVLHAKLWPQERKVIFYPPMGTLRVYRWQSFHREIVNRSILQFWIREVIDLRSVESHDLRIFLASLHRACFPYGGPSG